jgi:hypothetical protein
MKVLSICSLHMIHLYYQKINFIYPHLHHIINISKLKEAVFMRNIALVTVQSYKGGTPF